MVVDEPVVEDIKPNVKMASGLSGQVADNPMQTDVVPQAVNINNKSKIKISKGLEIVETPSFYFPLKAKWHSIYDPQGRYDLGLGARCKKNEREEIIELTHQLSDYSGRKWLERAGGSTRSFPLKDQPSHFYIFVAGFFPLTGTVAGGRFFRSFLDGSNILKPFPILLRKVIHPTTIAPDMKRIARTTRGTHVTGLTLA
ncbi:hypothetical protein PGT21_007665 [Puccinia graminis f. sp. tritici]|uniref:Uncharacterized protein n=1 Tax=Puccinia graminis f. sp. tritici TaxID=56615 RepID=A0A5B0N6P3_PUCGR|nr:hypothetical protein PGTUg99_030020 [Puccinia graminis f. sp. tritici]KAA1083810.1 hypothetical protein PGT21_007665 [Puccinia graminis f. sp. tritici]